jgi:hypothetical protein
MLKPILLALSLFPLGVAAAALTPLETRWLSAAYPVLSYAKSIGLAVDIVVQPLAGPNDVPLAMGYDKDRCKLVLSLRGNPHAEDQLQGVPVAEQGVLIQAMAAHELAHCWRHTRGMWNRLPAGFIEGGEPQADDPGLLAEARSLREQRREEGFADLAALAWTKRFHPESYGRVHAWLARLRAHPPAERSGHDTRVWVKLARDAAVLERGANLFEDGSAVWRQGLLEQSAP